MPEGKSIIVIWFHILCLAGKINDGGFVYFTKDIPFTDEMLAVEFDEDLKVIRSEEHTSELQLRPHLVCRLLLEKKKKKKNKKKPTNKKKKHCTKSSSTSNTKTPLPHIRKH